MNIGLIFSFVLMFVLIFGGGTLLVMWKIRQQDKEIPEEERELETAQQFLPFKDVKDGVIDLWDHEYRAVIECSSTNYSLKTKNEKNMIEASFQRFVNSLTYPITIFIQTKTINNTELLENMEKEINEICKKHPTLKDYAHGFYNEMANLESYTSNNRQKKKYIIVPYDESHNLAELNEREKTSHSVNEVRQRALVLIDALGNMGIKGQLLDTGGLTELIYSTYHKDNYGNVKNLINGEFLSLLVSGERNPQQDMDDNERMEFILHETRQRIENELSKPTMTDILKEEFTEALIEIKRLEKQFNMKNENGRMV